MQALNVVESREFRNLLALFRETFRPEDLPHHTKVRSAIIEMWQSWFSQLKDQLKVM